MIRTIDRYVVSTFLVNYLLSLGVLMSLYVALDLFVNFDEFTEAGKAWYTVLANVASYYTYNLPLYFSQISGVITLFAACGTLVRMQRQNEIVAILASGTSLYRLAAPIVISGLVMNALLIVDNEYLLPQVAPKLARQRDDVEGERVHEVWCIRDGRDRLFSAMRFSPKEKRIRGLVVMELTMTPEGMGRLQSVLQADFASWNPTAGGWDLLGGKRTSLAAEGGQGISQFTSIEKVPADFYPSELNPEELLFRQSAQWLRFLSVRQLNALERRNAADPRFVAQIRHGRFTAPINNMILLLLGMTFFLDRLPKSVLTQGAKAVATCTTVFAFFFIGQQIVGSVLAVSESPMLQALPAWLPIFLFGPLAVVLMDNVKT